MAHIHDLLTRKEYGINLSFLLSIVSYFNDKQYPVIIQIRVNYKDFSH